MNQKMKSVMSYVPEDEHREVRAILIREGTSFSEFMRQCIRMKIRDDKGGKAKRGGK